MTYQRCTFCVMDTTDPMISFDDAGECNHCREARARRNVSWHPGPEGARLLEQKLEQIRSHGRNKEFDCIIGLSGGVDSSYLALLAADWGLRPLLVHVDAGWNSEMAVKNIGSVVDHIGAELHTHVVNWNTMRKLQVSYLRAGIANQDVPQDHAFFAALYRFATRNRIKYVLNGFNFATECIFPSSWQGPAMDAKNLRAIHKRFGDGDLTDYPTVSMFHYYFWYPIARGMTPVHPLNYMKYDKSAATDRLSETGWRPYGRKHGESIFTRFFQNYYLVERFGFDKRLPHLSSMIVSEQLTRDGALSELSQPLYDKDELRRDLAYVCTKLRLSHEEFDELMRQPLRDYSDFDNWSSQYRRLKRMQELASQIRGRRVTIYG